MTSQLTILVKYVGDFTNLTYSSYHHNKFTCIRSQNTLRFHCKDFRVVTAIIQKLSHCFFVFHYMPCKFHAPCTTSIKPIAYIITLLCVNIFFLQRSNPSIFSSPVILFIISFFFFITGKICLMCNSMFWCLFLQGLKLGNTSYFIVTELCSI